jgi:hypothetical protein
VRAAHAGIAVEAKVERVGKTAVVVRTVVLDMIVDGGHPPARTRSSCRYSWLIVVGMNDESSPHVSSTGKMWMAHCALAPSNMCGLLPSSNSYLCFKRGLKTMKTTRTRGCLQPDKMNRRRPWIFGHRRKAFARSNAACGSTQGRRGAARLLVVAKSETISGGLTFLGQPSLRRMPERCNHVQAAQETSCKPPGKEQYNRSGLQQS